MDAIRQRDAAGLATLYAEDGQLLAASGEFLRGRPEIQAYWQSLIDANVQEAELEMIDVAQSQLEGRGGGGPGQHGRQTEEDRTAVVGGN